ncbi:glutathione S-transferase domain-containing protein [Georgenia yuyongxinii]|uniref:Glutathione S-transferase domain-containing protein n=1 Tax=Georgenia yuyongxinii TaxID=2589797 RepID=A0A5B8C6G4_9MICO|nr:glutathione S-transferase C-terminal domain-containing protein [Georgenia yuyongxinii]QDC23516.1 glutathione S-transferase domain-containing protein [Georgenia yuyongxinii]
MTVRLNHPRPGVVRGAGCEQPARSSTPGCGDAAAHRPAAGYRRTVPTPRASTGVTATPAPGVDSVVPAQARAAVRRRLHERLRRLALPPEVELVPNDLADQVLDVVERLEQLADFDAARALIPTAQLSAALACYDEQLAAGGWLAGDRVTAADLHLWAVLVRLSGVPGGGDVVEDLDHLRGWSRRLCERHGRLTGVVAAYLGPHPPG